MRRYLFTKTVVAVMAVVFLAAAAGPASGAYTKQEALIDEALITFKRCVADPNMKWFREHLKNARGILIFPSFLKGAFLIGAEGGTGVLLVHDLKTGEWSQPVFYTMGSASIGLQIGAKSAEMILMVMTDKGTDALLSTSIKLGADVSVAAGPVGVGAKAETIDILAFSRGQGLFGGVSVEGTVIVPRDDWNRAFYGKDVRPVDIIIRRVVSNPSAQPLIQAVKSVCDGKELE
jgi:lipid-binding SYLF domain-containing protein